MARKNPHVVPHGDGWAVKKEGASRASKVFDRQVDAIDYARAQAQRDHSELFIHGKDGRIRERDSHGHDSRSSAG